MGSDLVYKVASENDLVEIVEQYLALNKTGKNFKGLCPFHMEKTPSFIVSPDTQLWHCFGCGKGGNIYTFLMSIENIEFKEALQILAKKAGISLTSPKEETKYNLLSDINQTANKFFINSLFSANGKKALDYLIQKRGFSLETIKKFSLGYAPVGFSNLLNYLTNKKFKIKDLIETGLIIKNQNNNFYDRFRDRIIFPIFSNSGSVIGFGGRTLSGEDAKYINSPESAIFYKGKNIYGFNFAREQIKKSKEVFLVEGYMDVMALYQAGLSNAVASMGTSLTEEQVALLSRFAEKVYMAYDGDIAGSEATKRGMETLFVQGCPSYVLELSKGEDPDSFLKKNSKEDFEKLKNSALPYFDFFLNELPKKYSLKEPLSKAKAAQEIIKVLSKIADVILQDIYLNQAAKFLGINYLTLRDMLPNKKTTKFKKDILKKNVLETKSEALLLASIIINPDFFWNNLEEINTDIFEEQQHKEILEVFKKFYKINIDRKGEIKNLQQEIFLLLNETANKYLAEIIFTLGNIPQEENHFHEILNKIREKILQKKLTEIQNKVQSAEKEKNFSLAKDLASKIVSLRKELKNLKLNLGES